MIGVVIGSRIAWTVTKGCPHSFYHKGDWYVWDKHYKEAVAYYQGKEK